MRNLIFVLFIAFLFSCEGGKKILPESTGSANEIIVVVSDEIWDKYPSKAIKESFAKNYPGLLQLEPFFKIIRIKPAEFSTIFKTHQNIILISENQLQDKNNNLWAYPQIVVGLQWNAESDRKKFIEKCESYTTIFYQNQLQKESEKFSESNKRIKKNFGIDVKIPSEYTIIVDSTSIFWATFNPIKSDLIKQILVFKLKVNEINFQENLIIKVDSVLEKTLKGKGENNFVQIEKRFPLEISTNTYRGLWKMEKKFMGGPFLMKIRKKNQEEIIVSIGIVFAPGNQKKHFIIEMDAIL
ncbi:MAG: DUF4837 family protein [Flavobacteriales bacterium]|nr:DUF4837 family protein [Flavobacteriales bacterium]